MRSIPALLRHDFRSFLRYKWFLAGLIGMNLTDLFIMAVVVTRMVPFDYFRFVAPGIAIIGLFAAAFMIGREVSFEIRTGINQYLLSLPMRRWELVVGRMLAGGLRGMAYCSPLLVTALAVAPRVPPLPELLVVAGGLLLLAMGISGLAISQASLLRTFEKFVTARALLYYVLMFFSTVFYPLEVLRDTLPAPVALIAQHNPLSAAADLLRAHLIGEPPLTVGLWFNLAVFSMLFMAIGSSVYAATIERI